MSRVSSVCVAVVLAAVAATATASCNIPTIDTVNVESFFNGTWYELADNKLFREFFEHDGYCMTATVSCLDVPGCCFPVCVTVCLCV